MLHHRAVARVRAGLLTALAALAVGCGATRPAPRPPTTKVTGSTTTSTPPPAPRAPSPQALVTDETENQLLIVDLPSGRIARRVTLPPDPEDLAADPSRGVVVVVSSAAGEVTVLDRQTLRPIRAFAGFGAPHIAAISADGRRAYVTDDSRGALTVIGLDDVRVISTIAVGPGAHHLTYGPIRGLLWVALGESATRIAILRASNPDHPRLVGGFSPGFPVHDLSYTPDERELWMTSASGPDVGVFDAADKRPLFRLPAGAPPQHVAFEGRFAYLTSGYGGTIEKVDASTGRVITRASAPYGSFELDARQGYVVTSSLLRGTLAIYTPNLKLLRVVKVAPTAREVAISSP